jgi:hypothetical protein
MYSCSLFVLLVTGIVTSRVIRRVETRRAGGKKADRGRRINSSVKKIKITLVEVGRQ